MAQSRLRRRALCLALWACTACDGSSPRSSALEVLLPSPSPPRPGFVIWHELSAVDPAAAAAFYSDVLGWRANRDSPAHTTWLGDYGPVAGVSRLPPEARAAGAVSRWIPRIEVEDVDEAVARALPRRGQVSLEPVNMPGQRLASILDPGGAVVELARTVAPDAFTRGRATEFRWDEILTPDGAGTLRFYGEVFGWTSGPEESLGSSGRYMICGRAGEPVAGILTDPGLPAETWVSYVEVIELDADVERALRHGAVVQSAPRVVPDGRTVQLRDPQGAIFGLHEPRRVGHP